MPRLLFLNSHIMCMQLLSSSLMLTWLLLQVNDFLKELPIKALPGIGRALEEKLKDRHVRTCGELRMISKVFIYFYNITCLM